MPRWSAFSGCCGDSKRVVPSNPGLAEFERVFSERELMSRVSHILARSPIAAILVLLVGAGIAAFAFGATKPDRPPQPAEIPATLGWYEVPNSKLQSVCPPNDFNHSNYAFATECSGIVRAWNSAIAETRRNRLIVWGGGHNDYGGNEVYAFELATLQWKRLNDPSPITPCEETASDGKPSSRHTYGGLAYIADADRLFSFGGVLFCPHGIDTSATWTLGLENLDWTRMDPAKGGSPNDENHGTVSAYDPTTKLVYVWDRSSGFWSYDYRKNIYKRLNNQTPLDLHSNAVIDSGSSLFLTFGDNQIWAVSTAEKGGHGAQNRSKAKGCQGLTGNASPGLAYDPAEDRVIGWPDFGPTIYIYDSHTNSCTTQTFNAGAPPDSAHTGSPSSSNGTFGRFQYFPAYGLFVLVSDSDTNVRTLRLTAQKQNSGGTPGGNVQ